MVAEPGSERIGSPQRRLFRYGEAHECVGVQEHVLASRLSGGLGRIEVHAC